MKTLLQIIFSSFLLTFFSCNNSGKTEKNTVQSTLSNIGETEAKDLGNKIDLDKAKVIQFVYVIDKKGTEIKPQADKNAKTLGTYVYGTKLEVIEETEEWFGVRFIDQEGFSGNDNTTLKKVYVLKRSTGSFNEITLSSSDLYIIYSLRINQKNKIVETDKELKDFLKIELIDGALFENKRSSAINFLLADTTETKMKNGTLELKCQTKVKKYISNYADSDAMEVFYYVGQFEFLNKYLIGTHYYENVDYRVIDKTSGEETQIFGNYPYISPDKKHIICITTAEGLVNLELYSIDDKQIKHKMTADMKNWMPTVDPVDMFWSIDGYLYLTVNHIKSFWNEMGSFNDKCQHIRIKVL